LKSRSDVRWVGAGDLAACANAVSSVLQRKANTRVPQKQNLSLRLIWSLVHERRREWGSAAAMTVGLAGLLFFLSPSAGLTADIRWYAWLTGTAVQPAAADERDQ
jgi:hypothetical protein